MNRQSYLGGTDASAILGVNPWRTAYDVFLEKTGQATPTPDNPAMYWGRALEPLVINKYEEETRDKIISRSPCIHHNKYEFIVGNLDALSSSSVIEAKTARNSNNWGEAWTDEVPEYYLVQVQHYMMLTGLEKARIPVLFGASDFKIYEVPADRAFQEFLLEKLIHFWEDHVLKNTIPIPQNSKDIENMFRKTNGKEIFATESIEKTVLELKKIKQAHKETEAVIAELENQIKLYIEDNDILINSHSKPIVSWKFNSGRKTFDSKALEKDKPEIYKLYLKHSNPSRIFLVK